jgi:hypothetical protein
MAGLRLFNFGRQLLELSMRVRDARHWFRPTERAATRKFVAYQTSLTLLSRLAKLRYVISEGKVWETMDLFKMFVISSAGMSAQRSRTSVITGNLATKIEDSRHRILAGKQTCLSNWQTFSPT